MGNITVIEGQAAAVNTQRSCDTQSYETVIFVAFNLAGAEVATLYVSAGGVWVPLTDRAGAAVTLTLAAPSVALEGGPVYGVTKSATAGLAGVDMIPQTHQ
jgi:hypothetical protein